MPNDGSHRKTVSKTARRFVRKRIARVLHDVGDGDRALDDQAVHDTRKQLRKVRAIIRLVRGELGKRRYRRENRALRDLARPLSSVRDAKVLIETLDGLCEQFGGRLPSGQTSALSHVLRARRRRARAEVFESNDAVYRIVRETLAARKRLRSWPLRHDGWGAVREGLRRIYRRGSAAMDRARVVGADDVLHEWRKRCKDLRYALEFLESMAPNSVARIARHAHTLTRLLGNDHDLAVLRTIASRELRCDHVALSNLIDERRRALQREAFALGQVLYDAPPDAFVAAVEQSWKASRKRAALRGSAIPSMHSFDV